MTSTFSFARVRECNNYDSRDGVSYKYINCINKNFIKFSQDIDVDFFICKYSAMLENSITFFS